MPTKLKTYDIRQVYLLIAGIPCSGYGNDGGIKITPNAAVAEHQVGADGEVVVNRNNDNSHTLEITLMETSRCVPLLDALIRTQAALPAYPPTAVELFDLNTGDIITDSYCAFLARPEIAKGRKAGERVYKFLLPDPSVILGPANI
jgi:hypothetical protein